MLCRHSPQRDGKWGQLENTQVVASSLRSKGQTQVASEGQGLFAEQFLLNRNISSRREGEDQSTKFLNELYYYAREEEKK